MKLNSSTGETAEFTLPFLLNHDAWFEILGVENGVFSVRYCCLGSERFLLTWNPTTGIFNRIADPLEFHEGEPAFLYAFAFYPNSVHYAILHVFYEDYESPACVLTIYTSFRRNWHVTIPCPSYVHGLEPTYVTLDGAVYWISGSVEGIGDQPQYVVSFCIDSLQFRQIFIPSEAAAHCHSILAKDGHIYVASNNHDEDLYNFIMWRLDVDDENVNWVRMYEHRGNGSTYVPAIMADGAPIDIMERHVKLI
ncbi:hypothetical protein PIB30_068755 [Stylosanthes scabra]|uniref:F-box associated beta-propeller type 3 domain-containing protein n=1 Tax=Stylosanthes scabra TaxID=79078 RepID=A0ABU6WRB1_9FABA|nr:hypothetical protein [Stylosanthes scabra]